MEYLPKNKDICELTTVADEERRKNGDYLIPCIVEIEYQNDYCWLIRYKDNDQCNMLKKGDNRYLFKAT